MVRLSLLTLALLLSAFSRGQTAITDSLRHLVWHEKNPVARLPLLLALGREQQSLNRDTAYRYAGEAMTLAENAGVRDKSLAALYFARSFIPWGWIDSSMAVLRPVLPLNKVSDPQTRDIYFLLQRELGMLYGMRTRYKEALEIFYRLIGEGELYKDSVSLVSNMNSIGSVALAREQPKEALKWLYKALALSGEDERFILPKAALYINLANTSLTLNRDDSAVIYLQKAIPLARQAENLYLLSAALRVQTNAFVKNNELRRAEESFKELQSIKAKTNTANIADDNLATVDFYITIREFDKAIALCRQLLEGKADLIADSSSVYTSAVAIRLPFYEALAKCYRLTGKTQQYLKTLEQLMEAKDSAYKLASAREIADIQEGYETRIKENTIIAQQRLNITRKNYLFYGLLGLLLLAAVATIIIFNEHRHKQKIKMENAVKDEKRLAEEGIKNAEEKERVRIAADLHDNLGVYAASMASNLGYLKSYRPEENTANAIRELTANSRAMITELNDTIWALKKRSLPLTAISDRIKIFINNLGRSYPSMNMEVLERIEEDILFSASQGFHIYRIVQEAVNNALKHSGGKNIVVRIYASGGWQIAVADDGSGMAVNDMEKYESNGCHNMRARCRENGWKIEWSSGEKGGTVLQVSSAEE